MYAQIAIIVVILALLGGSTVFGCKAGGCRDYMWAGATNKQLAGLGMVDAYTLTNMALGMVLAVAMSPLKKWSFATKLAVALAVQAVFKSQRLARVAWALKHKNPGVLVPGRTNLFTMDKSLPNVAADIAALTAGFAAASYLPWYGVVPTVLALEVIVFFLRGDGMLIDVLALVAPKLVNKWRMKRVGEKERAMMAVMAFANTSKAAAKE